MHIQSPIRPALSLKKVECAEVTTLLLSRPPEFRNRLFLAEVGDHTSELVDLCG